MNKTVLITGGSRGIGKETAIAFSKAGYNVVINYNKSEKEAVELALSLGNAIAVRADVKNRAEVKEMVKLAKENFSHIDVLINNAGIAEQKLFFDITEEDWDEMIGVNLKGIFNLCAEVAPDMVQRRYGKVINISSIWGISGASCEVHYSAAKSAVIGFTKALAKELGPSQVNVNCIAPGVIDTDMNKKVPEDIMKELADETPLMRLGTAKDVAEAVLFLASDKASFITGQVLGVDGGII